LGLIALRRNGSRPPADSLDPRRGRE